MQERVRDFLQKIAQAQERQGHGALSVHAHVLRNGRPFESVPLTPEEQQYVNLFPWRSHQPRQCYYNAQLMAMSMPPRERMKLLYAEGFLGFGSSYAIPHAWLSLNGKVVDTTVRPQESGDQRVMGTIPRGWEYYGAELETERCIQVLYILQVRPSGPDLRAGPGTEHQHHLPPVRARRQEKQKVTSQLQMQSLRVPSGSRPERGRIHPAQGPSTQSTEKSEG